MLFMRMFMLLMLLMHASHTRPFALRMGDETHRHPRLTGGANGQLFQWGPKISQCEGLSSQLSMNWERFKGSATQFAFQEITSHHHAVLGAGRSGAHLENFFVMIHGDMKRGYFGKVSPSWISKHHSSEVFTQIFLDAISVYFLWLQKQAFFYQQIESLTFFCHWSDPNPLWSPVPDPQHFTSILRRNMPLNRHFPEHFFLDYMQIPRKKIHPIVTRKNQLTTAVFHLTLNLRPNGDVRSFHYNISYHDKSLKKWLKYSRSNGWSNC